MTHQPRPAFASVSGSKTPRLVLVGEAFGQNEDETKRPFVGESGKELWRMLGEAMPDVEPELHLAVTGMHKYGNAWIKDREAWLAAAGIAMTNVLAFRPPSNKVEDLCGSKKDVGEFAASFPPVARGNYLRAEYLGELDRLRAELAHWAPNLVVALGNTACWALLRATNIGSIRGAITQAMDGFGMEATAEIGPVRLDSTHPVHDASGANTTEVKNSGTGEVLQVRNHSLGLKVLPTYHPSAVLRTWAWRPIVVADLMKAHREAQFPEIRRPSRTILVSPTIEEVEAWEQETYQLWHQGRVKFLAPDIETASGQITCIGFARSPTESMVIPFWDRGKPGYSYWPDAGLERRAFDVQARLLESAIPKIWQNGIYDNQYLTRFGVRTQNNAEDTMLLHHSIFPEMQKGLGFLGSIYSNEMSWKLLRRRKPDSEKKDE